MSFSGFGGSRTTESGPCPKPPATRHGHTPLKCEAAYYGEKLRPPWFVKTAISTMPRRSPPLSTLHRQHRSGRDAELH